MSTELEHLNLVSQRDVSSPCEMKALNGFKPDPSASAALGTTAARRADHRGLGELTEGRFAVTITRVVGAEAGVGVTNS
jgi:hypothetical protein